MIKKSILVIIIAICHLIVATDLYSMEARSNQYDNKENVAEFQLPDPPKNIKTTDVFVSIYSPISINIENTITGSDLRISKEISESISSHINKFDRRFIGKIERQSDFCDNDYDIDLQVVLNSYGNIDGSYSAMYPIICIKGIKKSGYPPVVFRNDDPYKLEYAINQICASLISSIKGEIDAGK